MCLLGQNGWNNIHTKTYSCHLKGKKKYKLTQWEGAISNEYTSNVQFCTIIISCKVEYLTTYLLEKKSYKVTAYFTGTQVK